MKRVEYLYRDREEDSVRMDCVRNPAIFWMAIRWMMLYSPQLVNPMHCSNRSVIIYLFYLGKPLGRDLLWPIWIG